MSLCYFTNCYHVVIDSGAAIEDLATEFVSRLIHESAVDRLSVAECVNFGVASLTTK